MSHDTYIGHCDGSVAIRDASSWSRDRVSQAARHTLAQRQAFRRRIEARFGPVHYVLKWGVMPQCRDRFRAVFFGLGVLVAVGGWPSEADACTPPPVGWSAGLQNLELPSDGYLIVSMHCSVDCGSGPAEPSITVRDVASGTEVPGNIAPLPDVDESLHLYGWRATDPLVAGESYEVVYSSFSIPTTVPITVVSAGKPDLEAMGLTTTIGPQELDAGERICCPNGPIDTCGGMLCFRDKIKRSVSIMLDWSLTREAARFSQYLRRVTWDAGEPEPWNIGL